MNKHKHQEISTQTKARNNFSFLRFYKFFLPISCLAIVYGLVLFLQNDFSYGTDFKGGIEKQFFLDKAVTTGALRSELSSRGIAADVEKVISKKDVFIVRVSADNEQENIKNEAIFSTFLKEFGGPNAEINQSRLVSGVISSENKTNALWTALIVVGLIVAYLTFRFQLRYGVSAMVAVMHDVAIMLTITLVMGIEVNILTIVAILTIFGYSVNDTIILFDRVRELNKEELTPTSKKLFANMEQGIRMIFKRTVVTSLTTLFVVGALFITTEGEYKSFAFLLIVGIISGTYSSVYVALPSAHLLSWLKTKYFKSKKVVAQKTS